MTDNYFNYFTEVEEHFIRKRGKQLLVSPLDWCLVELWKENEIPLHIVLRGIDRSFESAEKRRKGTPRSLFYCHPAVMEAYEEFQESTLGKEPSSEEAATSDADLSREEVEAFVESLQVRLARRREEASERARARLEEILDEIRRSRDLDFEETDRSIGNIGQDLILDLAEEMDAEKLKEIKKEVRLDLKRYRKRISKEMYAQLQERHLEKKLSKHFGLPEFSLLRFESC